MSGPPTTAILVLPLWSLATRSVQRIEQIILRKDSDFRRYDSGMRPGFTVSSQRLAPGQLRRPQVSRSARRRLPLHQHRIHHPGRDHPANHRALVARRGRRTQHRATRPRTHWTDRHDGRTGLRSCRWILRPERTVGFTYRRRRRRTRINRFRPDPYVTALFDGTLLDSDSCAEIQTFVPGDDLSDIGIVHSSGLGIERYETGTITVYGHLGSSDAHSAFIGFDHEHGTAVGVQVNSEVSGPQAFIAIETGAGRYRGVRSARQHQRRRSSSLRIVWIHRGLRPDRLRQDDSVDAIR